MSLSESIQLIFRHNATTPDGASPIPFPRNTSTTQGISAPDSYNLLDLAQMLRPRIIVEIGTNMGYNMICLSQGSPSSRCFTCDTQDLSKYRIATQPNCIYVVGNVVELLKSVNEPIDFAFIDGDHSYEGIHLDLVSLLPRMLKRSILAVHDIHEINMSDRSRPIERVVSELLLDTGWDYNFAPRAQGFVEPSQLGCFSHEG